MKNYPVAGPLIEQDDIDAVTQAVSNDWYEHAMDSISQFETAFAKYVGREYAIALPSCTSGIHLALCALGIQSGDEVLIPNTTWIASCAPISYVGAKPVFVDINNKNWCLDPDSFKSRITEKTKALIVVDLYGNMPEWKCILKIAREYNIAIIEDAAEAIGSRYQAKLAGSFGDISVFSFHGSKTLTTGEGGILLTNDKFLYDRVRILQDHGRMPGDRYFKNTEIAFKYKITSMQAALGLSQLSKINKLIGIKRMIAARYQENLCEIKDIQLNHEDNDVLHSNWMSTLVLGDSYKIQAVELMAMLQKENIHTRPFFSALSTLKAYAAEQYQGQYTPVSLKFTDRGINLPSALILTEEDVDCICDKIVKILTSIRN